MNNTKMNCRVVIRVDASVQIGIGHVMRCLTLANAISKMGAVVEFICRKHNGNLIGLIRQKGFKVHELPNPSVNLVTDAKKFHAGYPDHINWLGCSWQLDAEHCCEVINGKADLLIVDHYSLDAQWERRMRKACDALMCIDDLADRPHDCDILLDQCLFRSCDDYKDLVFRGTEILAGSKYALLRSEFSKFRDLSLSRREKPERKRILITMGGVDKDNVTGKILEVLKNTKLTIEEIIVILGPSSPWLRQVQISAQEIQIPTQILYAVDNMAELMASSDLAISAGGSTTLERFCLGLPSITVAIADNQIPLIEAITDNSLGYAVNSPAELTSFLPKVLNCNDVKFTKYISKKTSSLCDGNGTERVLSSVKRALSLV